MKEKAALLNAVGGIPDIMLLSAPDVTVRKSSLDRDVYLRRLAFYDPDRWDEGQDPFLYLPAMAPESEVIETRPFLFGQCDLSRYPSRYRPRNPEVKGDFEARGENLWCYLHLWRHDDSDVRPLIIAIHGFMMGGPRKARRLFKIDRLFELGLDIALYTLPGQWRRSDDPRFQRLLDPADVPLTVERLAQNIHDLHSARLLLEEIGYRKAGIIGASQGGLRQRYMPPR